MCAGRFHAHRDAAERRHRVEDKLPAVPPNHRADFLRRVEHAGGGFAVHQRDMRDRGIPGQNFFRLVKVCRLCLRLAKLDGVDAEHACDGRDAGPVGAVIEHKQFAISGDH